MLIAHARFCDTNHVLCLDETSIVSFSVKGSVTLLGATSMPAEAGIASVVLRVPAGAKGFELEAKSESRGSTFSAHLSWPREMPDRIAVPAEDRLPAAPARRTSHLEY